MVCLLVYFWEVFGVVLDEHDGAFSLHTTEFGQTMEVTLEHLLEGKHDVTDEVMDHWGQSEH